MMTEIEVEKAIYKKVGEFTGVQSSYLRIENQPTADGKPFIAPTNAAWCAVSIQYGSSTTSQIGNDGLNVRDWGFVSIQCYVPKNTGTLTMANLCQLWRDLLQNYSTGNLEIYRVHAPEPINDDNFFSKIVRAEFRVN